ncbi:MAG: TonB-dependent receptor [Brumimicrobium sp.]|nr:TonB-dependent receptor [Brumimicrobium sp.]
MILKHLPPFIEKKIFISAPEEILKREVFVSLLLIILSFQSLSQEKEKNFNTVEIEENLPGSVSETTIEKQDIEKIAPYDLGHLLQRLSGVTIRSYGGLGGMKTLSMRGLGGQHTNLIINGYSQLNPQSGQNDFGLIQVENIEQVKVSVGLTEERMLPASGLISGNVVSLTTFEQEFSPKKISLRSSSVLGSFGQKESYFGIKKGGKSNFISATGKYRAVEGDYPFRIKSGSEEIQDVRKNNEFSEYFVNLGGGIKWGGDSLSRLRHLIKIYGHLDGADKQLPGAVILYTSGADENLETQNFQSGANYSLIGGSFRLRVFSSVAKNYLRYFDPTYNNAAGLIDNRYETLNSSSGVNSVFERKKLTLLAASELSYNSLNSNRGDLGIPRRLSSASIIKLKWKTEYLHLTGALANQLLSDQNRSLDHSNTFNRFSPQVEFVTSDRFSEKFKLNLWYKESMRPPSFNELFYSQIGNKYLEPEENRQSNLGISYLKKWRKSELNIKVNGYYNLVDNKILALPTKNLFIWSVSNVGKVEIYGTDLEILLSREISKNSTIEFNGNFTFQRVLDISDRNAPTFRHQIAYTPSATAQGLLSFYLHNFAWHTSAFYTGERYSLNQNIPANSLERFVLFDSSLEVRFSFAENQVLKVQGGVKNIFDSSYSFIKYFVMPGRNYFLKVSYAIN